MRIDEIEARLAEINGIVNGSEEFDVDALTSETRALIAEKAEIEKKAKKEAELRTAVSTAAVAEIEKKAKDERNMDKNIEIRNTPKYIEAFANCVKRSLGDTTDFAECRALLTENASDGTVAVPDMVLNTIKTAWDDEMIMARVNKTYIQGNVKIGFEISATDAVEHVEGSEAPDEENLSLGIVTMVAVSLKKWLKVSDEVLDLASAPFLQYVFNEVGHKLAKANADKVVTAINTSPVTSSATAPAVPKVTATTIAMGTIAAAIANLSDEARNPVIIMNKQTLAAFKAVQYANGYGADPFEGLDVLYNNSLKAFSAAGSGETYAIVGDLGFGALANYPNGQEITIKIDDKSLMEFDLVKILGRIFVASAVVAPNAFVRIVK